MIDQWVDEGQRTDHSSNVHWTPTENEYDEHVRHLLEHGDLSTADFRILKADDVRHRVPSARMNAIGRRTNMDEYANIDNHFDHRRDD